MSFNEITRLDPDDWRDAVDREFRSHDEAHAISTVRARKYTPALGKMVRECGVTGVIQALGNAIEMVGRNGRARDPFLSEKNAGRVKRFVKTLRRRQAGDDVVNALTPEDHDSGIDDEDEAFDPVIMEAAAEIAKMQSVA